MRKFRKALCRKHQPTTEARKLGKKLKELGNWDVIYEGFDGHKNVDISIPEAKIDIEVDGLQHTTTEKQALSDLNRTYYSYKNDNFVTLHVPNILFKNEDTVQKTAEIINNFLEENYNDVKDNFFVSFLKKIFNS